MRPRRRTRRPALKRCAARRRRRRHRGRWWRRALADAARRGTWRRSSAVVGGCRRGSPFGEGRTRTAGPQPRAAVGARSSTCGAKVRPSLKRVRRTYRRARGEPPCASGTHSTAAARRTCQHPAAPEAIRAVVVGASPSRHPVAVVHDRARCLGPTAAGASGSTGAGCEQ